MRITDLEYHVQDRRELMTMAEETKTKAKC